MESQKSTLKRRALPGKISSRPVLGSSACQLTLSIFSIKKIFEKARKSQLAVIVVIFSKRMATGLFAFPPFFWQWMSVLA